MQFEGSWDAQHPSWRTVLSPAGHLNGPDCPKTAQPTFLLYGMTPALKSHSVLRCQGPGYIFIYGLCHVMIIRVRVF